jgi:hypothetical protein
MTSFLIRDSGTHSICSRLTGAAANDFIPNAFVYETTAGSTSTTTFYVRVASQGGNAIEINGFDGNPLFGGTCLSTLEIFEFGP